MTFGQPTIRQIFAINASRKFALSEGIQFTLKSAPVDPLMKALIMAPRPNNDNSNNANTSDDKTN
jgi:hypothetical protein